MVGRDGAPVGTHTSAGVTYHLRLERNWECGVSDGASPCCEAAELTTEGGMKTGRVVREEQEKKVLEILYQPCGGTCQLAVLWSAGVKGALPQRDTEPEGPHSPASL